MRGKPSPPHSHPRKRHSSSGAIVTRFVQVEVTCARGMKDQERVAYIYLLVFGAFQGRYRILHFKGSLRFPNELLSLRKPISVCLLFNRCVGRQRAVVCTENLILIDYVTESPKRRRR